MNIDVPEGYKSKDVIDRRDGQKPTLMDKAEDVETATRRDYEESFGEKSDDKSFYDPDKDAASQPMAKKVGKKKGQKSQVRVRTSSNKSTARKRG